MTLVNGLAAWALAACAQQSTLPVIGFLSDLSPTASRKRSSQSQFHQGLADTGFVEGRNLRIEYRWAEEDYSRLPGLAADLVRRQVAVLVSSGAVPTILAAKAATATIPIVFATGGDPVQLGLVASLSRPGGNLTGASNMNIQLLPKRLELLHELVPTSTRMALLVNPSNPAAEAQVRGARAAAREAGLELDVLHASAARDLATAFDDIAQSRAGGLAIAGDGLFVNQAEALAALALQHHLPAIFQYSEFTAAGGLISYSSSLADNYRLIGLYTGRILKGEKPADLPVYQTKKIELIVNLKTAKALGLTVPRTLLAQADGVIE